MVTETRVYQVPDEEAERYKMLAFLGPLEMIPEQVSRTASVFEDDD